MRTHRDRLPRIPYPANRLPAGGPWMTEQEAADHLGIGHLHLGWLIGAAHRLEIVRTTSPACAVTRAGVETEQQWRATASRRQKTWRLLRDVLKGF
ncbi:hypothetical protein [Kitasatospora sp. KL5]|uniref:hypothetical protein n=1 Tax=Kitasatospora sp. KL5 TaxID=3425125 RepID=UPI003D6FA9C9